MSAMLHARETCTPTLTDLYRMQRNVCDIIYGMCGVITEDQVSSQDLLQGVQLEYPVDLDNMAMWP